MSRKGENIYKRKDGRWEGRYVKSKSPSGKTQYGYVYAKTYRDAKHFRTSPNYVDALQMANEADLSDFDIEQLYTILNVARPDCI